MKTILLLHGAIGSKQQFEPLTKILQEKKFDVHTLNFFGHGGEPFHEEGFGIKIFAWQLQNFIKQNNLKKPAVFGYSMGGYVALRLAYKFPGLLGDIITLGTKFAWMPEAAAKEAAMLNPKKIEEKIPAFAESLKAMHAPNDWKELLAKTSGMLQELGNAPLLTEKEFFAIQNRVAICVGENDNMVTREESERAAQQLPNGRFVLLKDTPHPIEKVDVKLLEQVLV